jgi:DNA-binding transcriptional LysR family regulator
MDRLQSMGVFARVVEAASFSAAARQLGLSRAAVSKRIIQLESDLGVRLLNRTTRRVLPTEIGRAYYDACVRTLAAAGEAEAMVRRLHAEPRGTLRINAPHSFGTLHLGPAVAAFAGRYPDLAISLTLNDRIASLADEHFDVALRIARDVPANLVAHRLAPVRIVLCAAPAYLEAHGTPQAVADLARHKCLHYSYMASGETWPFYDEAGEQTVRIHSDFIANNGDVLLDAAAAGLGITSLPTFMTWRALAEGKVVPVLPAMTVPPLTLFAVHEREAVPSAKVRLLIAFLAEQFGPDPYWDRVGDGGADGPGGGASDSRLTSAAAS